MEFSDAPAKKYCNPSTDCYIKNVGIDEKARGKGLLGTAVAELCGNMPIYLETHTESKVALYGKTGFGLRETSDYHGVPVFAMTRTGA